MKLILYLILCIYLIVGAYAMVLINKKKSDLQRKENWLKYFSYLVIVGLLFTSILFDRKLFHYLSIIIIFFGYFEIIQLIILTKKVILGFTTLVFFTFGFYGFYEFSLLDRQILFYVLFIVIVFDAFSQLTGQLFGKRKLLPAVSPNKTIEGLIGGYLISLLTSILLCKLLKINIVQSMALTSGISAFAFLGDISASFIKRKFGVKDFSHLIPGQGGFLDRFDSLIFSSLFIFLIHNIFNL